MRGPKNINPRAGVRNIKGPAEKNPSRGEETEQHELRDVEQAGQDDQPEPEAEEVCGYRVHPAAAVFPRIMGRELQALADDIKKHGQRHDIVQHPDSSILDGLNRLRACEIAGREPRIVEWDGKPGEELAYVVSQNVARRNLDESQRGIIASELAALRSGQRQAGKFAGLPTQAEAADMMQVSERTVRIARKVLEEAPANVIRLVKQGRISLNAAKCVVSRVSTEDKQRIEGMPDDDAEAEVKRLNKESATNTARVIEASANTTDDDDDDNRRIGAEAVSRALNRTNIEANTFERRALVSAIERLPLSDAAWASELTSYLTQEAET